MSFKVGRVVSYIRQVPRPLLPSKPCNIKGQECRLCDFKFEGSFDYETQCPNKGRKAMDILAPKLRKWAEEYKNRKHSIVDIDELLKGMKK